MERTPTWEWRPDGPDHFVLMGPISAEGSTVRTALEGVTTECRVTFRENLIDYDFPPAARLMVAAPELLEELREMMAMIERVAEGSFWTDEQHERYTKAKAAITKATGA